MSKFHEDWEKICVTINIKKTAPPPGGFVFLLITTIFNLVRDIHITYATNVTSRVGHVFLPIQTIFKLNCRIQETNIGPKMFTCFHYIQKTVPPPGGHVFPPIMTIFELVQDIYKINAKNVTSRERTTIEHCAHSLLYCHRQNAYQKENNQAAPTARNKNDSTSSILNQEPGLLKSQALIYHLLFSLT
ncbi:hypothetical protein DPMN_061898 [Dreissena polymorpha]|uniref:Uncharacterized protein n=1 Tax=Dreissena polymorpha TaxID=45954 RepID=A0A9D4C8T7_DREPO|nr:hypothetical protein DPMN_061898 [Dreissena polymorpha]